MDFILIITGLLIAELVMWELPQILAGRLSKAVGILVCLLVSGLVVCVGAWLVTGFDLYSGSGEMLVVAVALFLIFATSSIIVFLTWANDAGKKTQTR